MNLKTHEYTPDDVECGYCTEFSKKTGCKAGSCKYLAERIQAGVLTYQDAVMSMHPQKDGVSQRLQEVAANPSGFWMDEAHHRRMRDVDATMGFIRKRNTPRYRLKILNTINFKKSMHYNPFAYIHSEKDILKLVTALIANTKGEGKAGDDFWVKAETLLYTALIGYIHYEAPEEEQCFSMESQLLVTITVVNFPVFELPKTGSNALLFMQLEGIVCTSAGLCLSAAAYRKKKV